MIMSSAKSAAKKCLLFLEKLPNMPVVFHDNHIDHLAPFIQEAVEKETKDTRQENEDLKTKIAVARADLEALIVLSDEVMAENLRGVWRTLGE
jgi:hypothetical protein